MYSALRRDASLTKIFWLLPVFALLAILPQPMLVGFGALGCIAAIVLWKYQRFADLWIEVKPFWPLLAVLILFYLSPYTNVAPSRRSPGAYFSIYTYFAGLFSILNLALVAAFVFLVISKLREGKFNIMIGDWRSIGLLFFMFVIAFTLGLLHADGGILHYGVTELKRPIIAMIPALYMLVIYILIVNSIQTPRSLHAFLRWIDRLTFFLIIYGIYRLMMIFTRDLETMWMFGLPIVLYDQMAMFYVPVFTLIARWSFGLKIGRWQFVQLAVMTFFILSSTRRYNYLLLAGGFAFVLFVSYACHAISLQRLFRLLIRSATGLGIAAALLFLFVPKFADGIVTAVQSLDLSSRVGQKFGSNRAAIIGNIFANLDCRPYTYVSGFGLGTMWHAVEYQPVDPFTKRLRKNDGWYTQFSVPYISLLFRFGLIGTSCLLFWLFHYLRARIREIPKIPLPLQTHTVGMIVYLVMIIPALADSLNPTGWVLCGLYMGLLERFAAFDAHQALASVSHEAQHRSSELE